MAIGLEKRGRVSALTLLAEWLRDPWRSEDYRRMHRRAQAAEGRELRLRAALARSWLFEMTYQNEPDDPSVYSDGWMCAGCFDDWPTGERPSAETADEVKHHPSCALHVEAP